MLPPYLTLSGVTLKTTGIFLCDTRKWLCDGGKHTATCDRVTNLLVNKRAVLVSESSTYNTKWNRWSMFFINYNIVSIANNLLTIFAPQFQLFLQYVLVFLCENICTTFTLCCCYCFNSPNWTFKALIDTLDQLTTQHSRIGKTNNSTPILFSLMLTFLFWKSNQKNKFVWRQAKQSVERLILIGNMNSRCNPSDTLNRVHTRLSLFSYQ